MGKEGLSVTVTQTLHEWSWFFHNCLQMHVHKSFYRELRGFAKSWTCPYRALAGTCSDFLTLLQSETQQTCDV